MRILLLAAACCSLVFAQGGVTGAPYSAEEVVERTRTLIDGTHITLPRTVTTMYRDSFGRTREESTRMVYISDPIAGYWYRLDSAMHVAHRTAIPSLSKPTVDAAVGNVALRRVGLESSTESLGTKMISGVLAEGQRNTVTFATGTMGNDRPIVTTSETWTSPELHITLLSSNHDPRSGERTTKLENLSRAEPDPSLFQVPPGYEIVDEPAPSSIPVKWP